MVKIVPAILTNNIKIASDTLRKAEKVVDRVQIDIIDGAFAQNETLTPKDFLTIKTSLNLDFQLMVEDPLEWVDECARAGADRIIGHIEMMPDQQDFIQKVQKHGLGVGFGLDLDTPVSEINEDLLKQLDIILVMSVPAGFGGQPFDARALDKIHELKSLKSENNYHYKIHDDGGITLEKIAKAHAAGADEVSIGQRLIKGDLAKNLAEFTKKAESIHGRSH